MFHKTHYNNLTRKYLERRIIYFVVRYYHKKKLKTNYSYSTLTLIKLNIEKVLLIGIPRGYAFGPLRFVAFISDYSKVEANITIFTRQDTIIL